MVSCALACDHSLSVDSVRQFIEKLITKNVLRFSIGPRHFSDPDDLPSPTTANRLQPLANTPDIPDGPILNKSDVTEHVILQVR